MVWRRKSSGADLHAGAASPSSDGDEISCKVPKGHVPMVAGFGGDGDGERVLVPVRLLGDPCIAELLDMAAQSYGYDQPGVLRVPCDAGHFRRVVESAQRRGGRRPVDMRPMA